MSVKPSRGKGGRCLWSKPMAFGFIACVGLASPALAQMGPPNPDTDRDGKVTWPEYRNMAGRQSIDMLDKNNDGRIAKTEVQALLDKVKILAGPAVVARILNRFDHDDQNKDGYLSLAEAEVAAKTRFEAGDENNDGWLSKAERKTMQKAGRGGSGS